MYKDIRVFFVVQEDLVVDERLGERSVLSVRGVNMPTGWIETLPRIAETTLCMFFSLSVSVSPTL